MAKITLARAFVLRGFFRKTISELDREIRAEDLTSEIDTTEEFFKDEGRQAYFIPVAITLKYLSDEVQSHKWHFGLFHTPTNCNFWHVSIRVLDENNNEVSQIETIKNNGKKKIWKTARDFLVSDIISTKELFYKPMPTECYQ